MSLPLVLRLRVQEAGNKRIRLYLPLFLVWLMLFPLLLVVSPFILIAAALTWKRGDGRALLLSIPLLISVIWSLSGLHIQVAKPDSQVLLWIK